MVVVAPSSVTPGSAFVITVSAQVNESGAFTLSDDTRPLVDIRFFTDLNGVWEYRDVAPRREVALAVRVLMDQSGSWSASIQVLAPPCTSANAANCLGFLRNDLFVATAQLGVFIAALIFVLNIPTIASALLRYRKDASLRGGATVRELAKAPLSMAWTLLAPMRQISETMPTERVAVELKRREALAELVAIAKDARRFDYERHHALVQSIKRVIGLYNLERSIIKRSNREA